MFASEQTDAKMFFFNNKIFFLIIIIFLQYVMCIILYVYCLYQNHGCHCFGSVVYNEPEVSLNRFAIQSKLFEQFTTLNRVLSLFSALKNTG